MYIYARHTDYHSTQTPKSSGQATIPVPVASDNSDWSYHAGDSLHPNRGSGWYLMCVLYPPTHSIAVRLRHEMPRNRGVFESKIPNQCVAVCDSVLYML